MKSSRGHNRLSEGRWILSIWFSKRLRSALGTLLCDTSSPYSSPRLIKWRSNSQWQVAESAIPFWTMRHPACLPWLQAHPGRKTHSVCGTFPGSVPRGRAQWRDSSPSDGGALSDARQFDDVSCGFHHQASPRLGVMRSREIPLFFHPIPLYPGISHSLLRLFFL